MSEAIKDPYAYTHLTDFVFQQIMMSTDERLNEVYTVHTKLKFPFRINFVELW